MQVVLLAAGKSSRFYPFTNLAHKSLFPIMGKTILEHTLESMKQAKVSDVILVVSDPHAFQGAIAYGKKLGLSIRCVVQKDATGMGDGVLAASEFLGDEFFVLHAHHLDAHEFLNTLQGAKENRNDLVLLARKTTDTDGFGSVKISDNKLISLVEKPKSHEESSGHRLVGIYLLNKMFLQTLMDTPKDHYNFERALQVYTKDKDIRVVVTEQKTISLKYPWDLFMVSNYLLENAVSQISDTASISKTAQITGNVIIHDNAKILEGASIKGPCFIGKNVVIGTNTLVRNNSVIEEDCVIGANMEIKHSVILLGTTTHSGFIGDSIVGSSCKIAASFTSANVRLDRATIVATIRGVEIKTKLHELGVIMGNGVKIGIRVATMPGSVIGQKSIIGPGTIIRNEVGQETTYYTVFKEVVQKHADRKDELYSTRRIIVLFDIDYTLLDTDKLKSSSLQEYQLYDEIDEILLKIGAVADIGIFSEGNHEFQTAKLQRTGISDRFVAEHVHIVDKKETTIEGILKQYEGREIFLIDDKLNVLHQAKLISPSVFTIWVKRGIYATTQASLDGFTPDASVSDLRGIENIIAGVSGRE